MKCSTCGYDDLGTGDSAHVCGTAEFMRAAPQYIGAAPTLEAERAEFDKALAASFPDMPAREDGGAQNAKFIAFAMFQAGVALGRRTAAPVAEGVALPPLDAEGLPPLPDPERHNFGVYAYTAEQVRQAQRDAVEADRAHRRDGMSTALAEVTDRLGREAAENLSMKMELRALTAKLARESQRPAQSIANDEYFWELINAWIEHNFSGSRKRAIIAYIDGRTDGTAWISVAERLPRDGQAVAFVVNSKDWDRFDYLNGRVLGGTYNEAWCGFSVPGLTIGASHWMPLPAAPSPLPPQEEDK